MKTDTRAVRIRQWLSSSLLFTSKMIFGAALSLGGLVFVLAIVARLDVAFFEANGMLVNDYVREAFYYQIFQIDEIILGMIAIGLLAVAAISFVFCKSQFDYFRRLAACLNIFCEKWEAPPTALLGRFNPHVTYFFDIIGRRINGETEGGIEPILQRAYRDWPREPRVSWIDQLQLAVVSGMLGVFFSACCVIFYFKVSNRVVELANSIVHFSNPNGSSFLAQQFNIVNVLVWLILGLTMLSFIVIGYRFGKQIAEADYAILRDLRDFMEGNYNQRLFLRDADPAREFIDPMNEALDKIAAKLGGQSPAKATAKP